MTQTLEPPCREPTASGGMPAALRRLGWRSEVLYKCLGLEHRTCRIGWCGKQTAKPSLGPGAALPGCAPTCPAHPGSSDSCVESPESEDEGAAPDVRLTGHWWPTVGEFLLTLPADYLVSGKI